MIARIRALARHLRQDVRLFGVMGVVPYLADRMLDRASDGAVRLHKYWIVAQRVRSPDSGGSARLGDFEICDVTAASARYSDYPRSREVIRARFAQDAQCLACYRKDDFVGYIWFNVGPYEEDEVRCRFVPRPVGHASWDYDAYISEPYRLGRAFKRLWDGAFKRLQEHGVRVTYSRISAFNAASIAAHQRMGSKRVGTLFFLRFKRFQCMLGSIPPFLHLSGSELSRPTVFIGPRHGTQVYDRQSERL